ncbi:MAG: oxygen-dependent coproporphyrinogen oxidase [Chlamydiota bacterium]
MKNSLIAFLKTLQDTICLNFETLEPSSRFEKTAWDYKSGQGGGEMRVLRGDVFEKAAVNFSAVSGQHFPTQESLGPFFATGVSLITHMQNPHAPTAHMNIRYIETAGSYWLGGGYDLTPMGFPYEEDTYHFHHTAKEALDPFGDSLYDLFSKQAKEYFYIPHRNKERGVGGIFFDHFKTDDFEKDIALWKSVGESFIKAVMPIYNSRIHLPFSQEEKNTQIKLRSHYVEFNLLYDRGTKFGFLSGGNPEAILCSMPPLVSW